mmetsp:Transcript_2100/g.4234  ORF Transcript_2100/g.4234 Transcript_2100/m.4234 type:complete len:260 (-) Transcript_2100:481-1260(-)
MLCCQVGHGACAINNAVVKHHSLDKTIKKNAWLYYFLPSKAGRAPLTIDPISNPTPAHSPPPAAARTRTPPPATAAASWGRSTAPAAPAMTDDASFIIIGMLLLLDETTEVAALLLNLLLTLPQASISSLTRAFSTLSSSTSLPAMWSCDLHSYNCDAERVPSASASVNRFCSLLALTLTWPSSRLVYLSSLASTPSGWWVAVAAAALLLPPPQPPRIKPITRPKALMATPTTIILRFLLRLLPAMLTIRSVKSSISPA